MENLGNETQKQEVAEKIAPKDRPAYFQLALPVAILIAGVLIAGALVYNKIGSGDGTTDQKASYISFKATASDNVLGDKNAKVTIVEFADYRCPFCERFYQQSAKQLIKDYVETGKAKFIFKNYAFLDAPAMKVSTWTSEAAECAAEQNKFWEYHDWLYSNQAPESNLNYYSKANLIKYAEKISGANVSQFTECLNSDKYAKTVSDDLAQGKSFGITGTPTTLIFSGNAKFDVNYIRQQMIANNPIISLPNGNNVIVGAQPYSVFKNALDTMLK